MPNTEQEFFSIITFIILAHGNEGILRIPMRVISENVSKGFQLKSFTDPRTDEFVLQLKEKEEKKE